MPEEQVNTLPSISFKRVASYALLPGIFDRLQRLVRQISRFFFMFTQIFGAVGLIDKNHPCLRPENIGRYSFADIIGLAASNVVFDKKHIPQIVMFSVVILSIVLTATICAALVVATIVNVNQAKAQFFGEPKSFTPNNSNRVDYDPKGDWALGFLFRIFGDTGLFPAVGGGNMWFTSMLVGMLKYYSLAMLVIAAFMILYILIITLTESARTGQPFGTRFDSIWAPIRLALAIGLLMPIVSPGYNGAQMITFQAAVWGSNLATNVWFGGLANMSKDSKKFFSATMSDPGYRFVRDIFLVNLCLQGIQDSNEKSTWGEGGMKYTGVISGDSITYTFGPPIAPDFCGQVTFPRSPKDMKTTLVGPDVPGASWPEKTVSAYQEIAYRFLPLPPQGKLEATDKNGITDEMVSSGNFDLSGDVDMSQSEMAAVVQYASQNIMPENAPTKNFNDAVKGKFGAEDIMKWIRIYRDKLGYQSNVFFQEPDTETRYAGTSYKKLIDTYNTWLINSLTSDAKYGWTTAGVFYLRISSAMGTISKVVNNPPRVTILPSNLSKAFAHSDDPDANTEKGVDCSGWNLFLSGIKTGLSLGSNDKSWMIDYCTKQKLAIKMNAFLRGGENWFLQTIKASPTNYRDVQGDNFDRNLKLNEPETSTNLNAGYFLSPVLDGLNDMVHIDSKELNPLAAVIAWGNRMMSLSMIAYLVGLIGLGSGMTSLAFTLGNVLLLPGFILAVWVPMLPFLHFTFAVVEWMISILEAVIGMPLFALSLITLEGDGLGRGMDGVKRLFEIVLRPTVIVMSLIVSVIIFSAGVSFFNDAIALYSQGSAQSNTDQGMFGAAAGGLGMVFVYMFGIYTLATSCFKLIDAIPDNFGRWVGLEKGFGSDIKTGFSKFSELIVTGAAFRSLGGLSSQAGGLDTKIQKNRAKKTVAKGNKPKT